MYEGAMDNNKSKIEDILDYTFYELAGKGSKTKTIRNYIIEVQQSDKVRALHIDHPKPLRRTEMELFLKILKERNIEKENLLQLDLTSGEKTEDKD